MCRDRLSRHLDAADRFQVALAAAQPRVGLRLACANKQNAKRLRRHLIRIGLKLRWRRRRVSRWESSGREQRGGGDRSAAASALGIDSGIAQHCCSGERCARHPAESGTGAPQWLSGATVFRLGRFHQTSTLSADPSRFVAAAPSPASASLTTPRCTPSPRRHHHPTTVRRARGCVLGRSRVVRGGRP